MKINDLKFTIFLALIGFSLWGDPTHAIPLPYSYRCVVTDVPAAYRQTPKRLITVVLKTTDKRIAVEMPKFQEGIEESKLELEALKKKCSSIPVGSGQSNCLLELKNMENEILKDSRSSMYLSMQRNPMLAFDWRTFPEAQSRAGVQPMEPSILVSVGSMESTSPDSSAIHEVVRFSIPDGRDSSISLGFSQTFESGAFRNYHLVCSRLDEKF